MLIFSEEQIQKDFPTGESQPKVRKRNVFTNDNSSGNLLKHLVTAS